MRTSHRTPHPSTPPPRLAAALAAAARGWPVFPLTPRGKVPAVKRWPTVATTDPDQLRRWWGKLPYNPGIACEPAGLVVLDFDTARHPLPDEWARMGVVHGRDVFAVLADWAGHPDPVDTFTVLTPTGGEHRYFRAPPGPALRNTQGDAGARGLGPLIDVRAGGGAIAAAGSLRIIDGTPRLYRPHPDRPRTLLPLPGWLTAALTPPPPPAHRAPIPTSLAGERLRRYVAAALAGETAAVTRATPGTRAFILFRAAAALGGLVGAGVLDEPTAERALLDAARHHTGTEQWTDSEAARHIRNGLTRGKTDPRTVEQAGH